MYPQYPFTPGVESPAATNQAVFGSRNPQLFLRSGDSMRIGFRYGEYRTSDPAEIEFLLAVVRDEARGNKGVWVKQLPSAPAPSAEPVSETPDNSEDSEARAETAARPRTPRKRGA